MVEFRNKVVSIIKLVTNANVEQHISMKSIMRIKCSADVFASIISAVLNKQITPVGRTGDEIGDILFNKSEICQIIQLRIKSSTDQMAH